MVRVAILGGSFNPPQNAHVEIARYVGLQKMADEIWVIPCADHPFGKSLAPFADRLAMCRLAFQNMPRTVVNDIEQHLPRPSFTVQTLRHLRRSFAAARDDTTEFLLIMGSDVAQELPKWKDAAELSKLARIVIIPRGPGSPIPDVSATETRKRIQNGDDITDQVPAPVAQYIQSHQLYR